MEKKSCTICKELKPIEEFGKQVDTTDGLRTACKICYNKRCIEKRLKNPKRFLLIKLKSRAKKLGIPFDLTEEDIEFPEVCPVFNKPFVYGYGRQHDFSPSVDRLIPHKGYIKGNVIIVSLRANRIKYNASLKELEALVNFYKTVLK